MKQYDEKGLDLQDKIDELHEDLANLYHDRFDMISKDYENQISMLDHQVELQQKNLDILGNKGYIKSINFYQKMEGLERERLATLRSEIVDITRAFAEAMASGEIEENSEEWYEYKNSINDVEEAIADANIKLAEYAKTIRETKWSWFDYALTRMDDLTEETNFLIQLISKHKLFDDSGNMNDYGMATLGLRAVNYDAYMSKAEKYYNEMLAIERELASDPYNQDLIERRQELLSLQRSSIQAAEQEKEAVKSLVEEGFNAELDALKELIDTYTEALEKERDLHEYSKKVSDQSETIANIQKQLAAYTSDNSEENRARMQKLQEELKKAEEDLSETEYDRYIDDQKALLDDLYDEYEKLLNERLDNIDQLMEDMIEVANQNSSAIRETVTEEGESVGYRIEADLDSIFGTSGTVTRYHSNVEHGLSAVEAHLENLVTMVDAMVQQSTGVRAYASGGLVTSTGMAHLDGSYANPELVLNPDDTRRFLAAAQLMRVSPMLTELDGGLKHLNAMRDSGSGVGTLVVNNNIEIDHVQDYNDFVSQLQRDKKFENMMKDVVTGTAVGKSSLSKYKYNFG